MSEVYEQFMHDLSQTETQVGDMARGTLTLHGTTDKRVWSFTQGHATRDVWQLAGGYEHLVEHNVYDTDLTYEHFARILRQPGLVVDD